jgi:chromosome segregation ATPase
MSDPSAIDAATRRLQLALDALESAVERRREVDHDEEKVASQLYALGSDRSRLAAELDNVTARARRLETTGQDVARRLDAAMATIRSVINGHDG